MAKKAYEVAFALAAKMSSDFTKTFSTASKLFASTESRLADLSAEAGKVGSLVSARKAVAESSRAYAKASQNVARLGKEISATERPTKEQMAAFAREKAVLSRVKAELEQNRNSLKKLNAEANAGGVAFQALVTRQKALQQQLDKTAKAQQKLADIEQKLNDNREKQDKLGGSVFGGGLAGGMAKVGTTLNAGAIAGGSAMVRMGAEYQKAMNQLQASTGMTAAEVQKLEGSARAIYTSGLGESFSEVAQSMATVRQLSGLSGQALQDATRSAMVLSKTLGMDVNESARAGSALMKNFGISSKEAYDLIAYAAQNGANQNGDLLDTLNEYSVQYKALGFSADQFAAHLIQGAKDGAFSIDKVGDAIKEFNIRSKDGSTQSMEAFSMLGLNGERATQMFAAGGERAQLAFAEVVKRLQDMDDPVKRNAAGVALFGTQFEDLQAGALRGFAAIQKSAIDSRGAIDSIADLSTKDLGSQFSIIGRSLVDSISPAAKTAAEAVSKQMPAIEQAIQSVMPAIHSLVKVFVDSIPELVQWAANMTKTLAGAAAFAIEHFDAIAKATYYLGIALVGLKVVNGLRGIFLSISNAVLIAQRAFIMLRQSALLTNAVAVVSSTVMKGLAVATKALGVAFRFLAANPIILVLTGLVAAGIALYKNWDKIKEVAGIATDYISAKWQDALAAVKVFFTDTFQSLVAIMKGPINTVIGMINTMIDAINSVSITVPDWVPMVGGKSFAPNLSKIPQLAEGGVATGPTLATIGEGKEPEAVLPLSRLSGMIGQRASGSGSGVTVNFSPVINVSGSASRADIDGALQLSEKRIVEIVDRALVNRQRLAFA